jgi:hypothetical protein
MNFKDKTIDEDPLNAAYQDQHVGINSLIGAKSIN